MNFPLSARRSSGAFTLIELLVVITIIAVLAGLLLPVVSKVTTNAQKVQAKSTEMQIVAAIKSFQTDYGIYPVMPTYSNNGTSDTTYGASSPTSSKLMDILRADGQGDDATGTTLNTRRVVYIEMPVAKNLSSPKNGIGQDGQPYDPWGTPYIIVIDSNYDNAITNPYTGTSAGFNPINTGAIVWSLGVDKQGGQGSSKTSGTGLDDVISWQ